MMFLESKRLLLVILALTVGSFVFYRVADASNRPQDSNKTQGQAKVAEQTTCPVMGGVIDKEIFTTYKGKKVYFCCAGCKPKFESNPDKYIKKLPQFGNK